jgi:tRNA uridine 5-carbamoylmethylation protein Kti12
MKADKTQTACANQRKQRSKLHILTLCRRCKSDYESAGSVLINRGLKKTLEICDKCNFRQGVKYAVFNSKRSTHKTYSQVGNKFAGDRRRK